MGQPQPRLPFVFATHITPITCPHCGAHAHLIRRTPHPALKGELRTFECIACCKQVELVVQD